MNRFAFAIAAASVLAAPAFAQGPIGTVERGSYQCELPGNAAGRAGVRQAAEDFRIISASRYRSPQGGGTYLRRGDTLTMTSGPRNGAAYRIISDNFVRKLDTDGKVTRLRCLRMRGR